MGFLERIFGSSGPELSYDDIEPGMVFKVRGGDHYKVVKVESDGVHIVSVGSTETVDVDGMEVSMSGMHMPMSRGTWQSSCPKHVRTEPVGEHELEGYEMWREAGGGWF